MNGGRINPDLQQLFELRLSDRRPQGANDWIAWVTELYGLNDRSELRALVEFLACVSIHAARQRSIGFYCLQLVVTRDYLHHICTKYLQDSPKAIIIWLAMVEYRKMLHHKRTSLSEIARQMQFPDQDSFAKFFKRHSGMSPLQFRRNNQAAFEVGGLMPQDKGLTWLDALLAGQ